MDISSAVVGQELAQVTAQAAPMDMRSVLDRLNACVYTKDLAGRYTFANQSVCQLLGVPLQEILGKDDSVFFDLSVYKQHQDADRQVLKTGQTLEQKDVMVLKRDGQMHIHWSVKSPLYSPQGEIAGLCCVSTELPNPTGDNNVAQSSRVRVFVLSDFQLMLQSLANLIRSRPERYVLQGVSDTLDTDRPPWGECKPDVVLLDLDGDPERSLAWLRHWRAAIDLKALLMTRHETPAIYDQAMLAGARGLIDRRSSPEHLLVALERVCKGEIWLDHASTARLLGGLTDRDQRKAVDPVASQLALLTQREQTILGALLAHGGEPAKVVATRLHISESTLRNHLTSIYEKVGVSNRNGLLSHALRSGLAERLAPQGHPGE